MGTRGPAPVPVEDRFWPKVDQSAGPKGCWPWTGYRVRAGYGKVGTVRPSVELAHRVALRLSGVPVGEVDYVCHRCDNPPCCNPAHLFIGDARSNVEDMLSKNRGRWAYGTRHGKVVLTEANVWQIRDLRAAGVSIREIAKQLDYPASRVADIACGRTWTHLTERSEPPQS